MTQAVRRVRVLVADGSASQRAMLSHLLGQDAEIEVVGWAASGAAAMRPNRTRALDRGADIRRPS